MLTKHVCTRAQQRGISQASLYLVQRYGTETPDGIIMTRKNIAAVERETKDLLDRLSKLDGARLTNQVRHRLYPGSPWEHSTATSRLRRDAACAA